MFLFPQVEFFLFSCPIFFVSGQLFPLPPSQVAFFHLLARFFTLLCIFSKSPHSLFSVLTTHSFFQFFTSIFPHATFFPSQLNFPPSQVAFPQSQDTLYPPRSAVSFPLFFFSPKVRFFFTLSCEFPPLLGRFSLLISFPLFQVRFSHLQVDYPPLPHQVFFGFTCSQAASPALPLEAAFFESASKDSLPL